MTMQKRPWIIGVGLAITIGVVLAGYWIVRPVPGVTAANCERLHHGMTFAQVEAILGEPKEKVMPQPGGPKHWFAGWEGKDVDVSILFHEENRVAGGGWDWHKNGRGNEFVTTSIPPYRSLWDRVSAWTRL
jgi:hypothetical protein